MLRCLLGEGEQGFIVAGNVRLLMFQFKRVTVRALANEAESRTHASQWRLSMICEEHPNASKCWCCCCCCWGGAMEEALCR